MSSEVSGLPGLLGVGTFFCFCIHDHYSEFKSSIRNFE